MADATWVRYIGDVGDFIKVKVGGVADLGSIGSVIGVVWLEGTDQETTLTASVTDAVNNIVTITLGAWLQNTATVGRWMLQLRINDNITWPETGLAYIDVKSRTAL